MTTNNQRIDGYLGHEKQAQWLKMLGKAIGLGAKEGKGKLSAETMARIKAMPTPGQTAMAEQARAVEVEKMTEGVVNDFDAVRFANKRERYRSGNSLIDGSWKQDFDAYLEKHPTATADQIRSGAQGVSSKKGAERLRQEAASKGVSEAELAKSKSSMKPSSLPYNVKERHLEMLPEGEGVSRPTEFKSTAPKFYQ